MKKGSKKSGNPSFLPKHLPKKLAICSWQWAWVTAALPEEPYADLERVFSELIDRGFNTIRLDAGLNRCFRQDGGPRGDVEFCQLITGYNSRLRVVAGRGGGRFNVLNRLIYLIQLAKQYSVFVILSDWEYLHSTSQVADKNLRAEVYGVSKEKRLLLLARHHDRLLRILKEKDLHGQIAYVEAHNEVDYSDFPKGEAGKNLHEEAIAFLREQHPDILISGSFGSAKVEQMPDNVQVYDHHIYAGAAIYQNLWKKTVFHPHFVPAHPDKNELLWSLFEQHIIPYQEFMKNFQDIYPKRGARLWMYHNLNIAGFDLYMAGQYARMESEIKNRAEALYSFHAKEAACRNLPAVVSEGGFFVAPLNSRWEESEAGLDYFDFLTDLAIKYNFWGFLPTTYNGPEEPLWWAHPGWLKKNNTRFLNGD